MRQSYTLFCLFSIFLLAALRLNSQTIPAGTAHIQKIIATSYKDNGDTITSRTTYTYYDSIWNVLTNTNTLGSALKPGSHQATIFETPGKKVIAEINPEGDTLDFIVYLFDSLGNRTHYYQIRKGDTLNNQKRTYDAKNNNTELYNYKNGKYYLNMKFTYDDSSNYTSLIRFEESGNIIEETKYERNYKKGTVKNYKSYKGSAFQLRYSAQTKGNITRTNYKVSSNGINYGIMLLRPAGGYSITEKDENDNVRKEEVYNKKGVLVTSVYITYTGYP